MFLWDEDGTRELTMFAGCYTCESPDININGHVVRASKVSLYSYPPPGDYDEAAFRWADGGMVDLFGQVDDWLYFDGAAAISDAGRILAWRGDDGFLLTPEPGPTTRADEEAGRDAAAR